MDNPIKVLFLAPHLSTGGMPAFLYERIAAFVLYSYTDITVVEFKNYSDEYVVQKNKIKSIVPVITLGENKMELMDIIKQKEIDIVHIDEMIEGFDNHNQVPDELRKALYASDRTWRVIETCHNIWFNPDTSKIYHPDAYAFCTPYHMDTFANMPSLKKVIEYPLRDKRPIDFNWSNASEILGFDLNKTHVVNIGLWTPGKNQKEAIEVARKMPDVQFHFVGNQAPNFEYYWKPLMENLPDNCKVWGERDDVNLFLIACDIFMFNSTWECNPIVLRDAIGYGCKILARNLPQYRGMFDRYITPIEDGKIDEQIKLLQSAPIMVSIPDGKLKDFCNSHIDLYKQVMNNPPQQKAITINTHFVKQPFLEIKGDSDKTYTVKWIDGDKVVYQTNIKSNHWTRVNREYYTDWRVEVFDNDGNLVYSDTYNDRDKRVYISLDSKSLGDSIAWIPYCEEYRRQHGCKLIVSTFWNKLFKDVYPNIEFVEPGETVHNLYAMYSIGWFYDSNREPELPNTIPLRKAASNILGLAYEPIGIMMYYNQRDFDYGKYVTIATSSTTGCKYWEDNKWQEVIDYLINQGYNVVNVSLEDSKYSNCIMPNDKSIENTIDLIWNSEFFIGLSSGLSWLADALGKEVIMIANFTEEDHEFDCIRVTNKSVCHGCWNKPEYKFDKGDWNWCPVNKGTDKQFECQTSITTEMVIEEIKNLI